DWRDVPAYVDLGGVPLYDDPELRFQSRSERDNNPLRGEDVAYRLAMSGISSKFEWLGAYAYRKRGNYFSGKKQADFYQQPYQGGRGFLIAGRNPFLQPEHIALNHYPGDEIPNTSSKMESALLKTTFNISDFYKLQFNARYTQSTHGEILASRSDYRNQDGLPQWPLARADMQAYSIKFRADPVNKFIDLSTNIWVTLTDSKTNTGYGFPNFTYRKSETPNIIMNTSEVNRKENRFGFSFKNKMLLTDNLDVTLSGSYQNHELVPKEGLQEMIEFYGGAVRAGEREEYNGAVTMEWRPRDFLIINAGVRYGSYKAIDSYIKNRVDAGDLKMLSESRGLGYRLRFQTNETYVEEEIEQNVANAEHSVRSTFTRVALLAQITRLRNLIVMFPSESEEYQSQLVGHQSELNNFDTLLAAKIAEKVTAAQNQTAYVADHTSEWLADSDNHYTLANNACAAALNNPHYIVGSCKVGVIEGESVSNTRYQLSGSGWMPSLTTTLLFNDNSRAYVRYAETLRFPSLFESTSGFSAIPSYSAPLEPERAKLFEVAYIHYFEHSSVKLTYFSQNIEDVMDRDRNEMSFTNLDKQRTSGLELQGVYDNQIYFGDIAMAYSLSNEVCDETSAGQKFIADIIDDQPTSMATCIRGGFSQGSYLAAHAAPEWSASLLLGSRFFNQQLEMAVRTNYVSGNDDDEVIKRNDVTTVDAYAKYNFNKYIEVEFVGTNLTDIYYLESGSVSGMASPGRTVSLKLRGRF
ncbi:MAG: TonB-dependent receptor, partial [Gammaproteobacteria bacterium]|nr:TonB-dependent receptor [Gammaproteobacteria bacterium]